MCRYWAIGVAPSKDTYWTTELQPNSPYVDNPTEPNWQLQALAVALSTGPNGPGDAIGWPPPDSQCDNTKIQYRLLQNPSVQQ